MFSSEILAYFVYGSFPALFSFAIQFIALRIRDSRASPQDPHLGRKCLFYLFFNLAILLILFGLTMSSLDWCEYAFEPAVKAQENRQNGTADDPAVAATPFVQPPRDWFNDQQRNAAALVASGLTYALILFWLIRLATNDREFPAVRRSFVGSRLMMAGLILMATATMTNVAIFQRGETDIKTIQKAAAVSLVWVPFAAIQAVLLLWSSGWRTSRRLKPEPVAVP